MRVGTLPERATAGGVREQAPLTAMKRRLVATLRYHAVPLLIVLAAVAIGQAATLIQQPLAAGPADTHTYVNAARDMLGWANVQVEPIRTPGYVALLALVFVLSGGLHFEPVVFVQAGIAILSILECYVLGYRLTNRRWVACAAAALIAVNLYLLSWERVIYTETLSIWSLVTLFLCYERLVRRVTVPRAVAFGAVALLSIMIRPANLVMPALLVGLLAIQHLRAKTWRPAWRPLLLASVLVYGGVIGYSAFNGYTQHYFGLTDATNVNFFGKVEEYRLEYLPIDPQYAGIQADTLKFVASRPQATVPDPFQFPGVAPQKRYWDHHYGPMGAYATAVIWRYPLLYVLHSLGDMPSVCLAPGKFYAIYGAAPDGTITPAADAASGPRPGLTSYFVLGHGYVTTRYEPLWVNALLVISTVEGWSYVLLPLLLVFLLLAVWRAPKQAESFVMLAMLIAVVATVASVAFGAYSEFNRLRVPADWAMIMVTTIVVLHLGAFFARSKAAATARRRIGSAWRQRTSSSATERAR